MVKTVTIVVIFLAAIFSAFLLGFTAKTSDGEIFFLSFGSILLCASYAFTYIDGFCFGRGRLQEPEDSAIYLVKNRFTTSNGEGKPIEVLLLQRLLVSIPIIDAEDPTETPEYSARDKGPVLCYKMGEDKNQLVQEGAIIQRVANVWCKFPAEGKIRRFKSFKKN